VADALKAEEKVPFHKREITFRRPKKTKKQAVPAPIVEPDVPAEQPAVDEPVAAVVADDEPKEKKIRTKTPKPKRRRRGGRSSGPQKLVGLKIGASQLAAAVVENDGAPQLVQLARTGMETGLVVDGEVRDEDALAAAIKSFFSESGLPKRDVRIGLASNRIGVRTFDIGGMDDDEQFDNAVRFKAHEVLPIAVHESVLDYRIISERVGENGEPTRRVLLVVAPRDQIEPYVNACRKAGVKLGGVDLEAFALLRAFVEPRATAQPAPDEAAIVVVAIGHESSTLVVSGAGVCEFTRVFGWGGSALDGVIAKALDVTPTEAIAIKKSLSLEPGVTWEGALAETAPVALEAVRGELTSFARELVSSLQFYQKQPDSLGIGEVVITGGTSQLGGIGDALHTLVGVPVRSGDPLARVAVGRGVDLPSLEGRLGSLAVAIGLGIDDAAMRAVNLVPSEIEGETRKLAIPSPKVLIPAAAAVPILAAGALWFPAHSTVSSRQTELTDAQTELASLPVPNAGPAIDLSIKGAEEQRAAAVSDVLSSRVPWDHVMLDVSRVLPDNVWLTDVKAVAPRSLSVSVVGLTATTSGSPESTPTAVTISGYTFSHTSVAKLLARLQTVPSLSRVQLSKSAVASTNGRTVVQFALVADLRQPGGSA